LNIQESEIVKRLTILAAVFLPLSLATGVLSMQTRFAHLGYLLYDLIGVFLLVGFIAILVFCILKLRVHIMALKPPKRRKKSNSISDAESVSSRKLNLIPQLRVFCSDNLMDSL